VERSLGREEGPEGEKGVNFGCRRGVDERVLGSPYDGEILWWGGIKFGTGGLRRH